MAMRVLCSVLLCLLSPLLAWAQVCPPGSSPSVGLSAELDQMTVCPGQNGTVWVEGRLESKEPSSREAAIMAMVMAMKQEYETKLAAMNASLVGTKQELIAMNTSLVETKQELSDTKRDAFEVILDQLLARRINHCTQRHAAGLL